MDRQQLPQTACDADMPEKHSEIRMAERAAGHDARSAREGRA